MHPPSASQATVNLAQTSLKRQYITHSHANQRPVCIRRANRIGSAWLKLKLRSRTAPRGCASLCERQSSPQCGCPQQVGKWHAEWYRTSALSACLSWLPVALTSELKRRSSSDSSERKHAFSTCSECCAVQCCADADPYRIPHRMVSATATQLLL